jgi:hypothetical protein
MSKRASKKAVRQRDVASGGFRGIPIADPAVKPRGVSVKAIRAAVALAHAKRA